MKHRTNVSEVNGDHIRHQLCNCSHSDDLNYFIRFQKIDDHAHSNCCDAEVVHAGSNVCY